MQFSAIAATLFAAVALAAPAPASEPGLESRQQLIPLCSGLTSTAQCCATDVLGLADLDCANPPTVPASASDFSTVCADIGQRARCCALPVLGQDLICGTPAGVQD
ncbi:Cerato-ulmin hydrophobin family [Nemania sp. NC0429]|nr:Cerato-ulmin hydrophobin family [Nemania sp. NC0429]